MASLTDSTDKTIEKTNVQKPDNPNLLIKSEKKYKEDLKKLKQILKLEKEKTMFMEQGSS
jgi:hypothetical protein